MTSPVRADKKTDESYCEFRGQILGWYDENARELPWRFRRGEIPDPYHVWLSEVMLQQTTVNAVIPYFLKFVEQWPDVKALAAADRDEVMAAWAGLGYYSRARNLHACAQIVANDLGGEFPRTPEGLKALPGIGDYTGAAIMAIAYNDSHGVMDGNIERIIARYFAITDPLPKSKKQLKALVDDIFAHEAQRPGDLAQALMDMANAVCTPKSPKCLLCPVSELCEGYAQGLQDSLPTRARKTPNPQRTGTVFWIENDKGQVLLQRRPDNIMLGGMVGLPCTAWYEKDNKTLPFKLEIKSAYTNQVLHSFTHFDLTLDAVRASLLESVSKEYFWQDIQDFDANTLPTLFKKCWQIISKTSR